MAVTQPTNVGFATASGTTTVSRSFPTLPAIGDVICVFWSTFDAGPTTVGCTDNQGHTYTKRYGLDAANTQHECWTTVVTASSGTFTVTMTRNNNGDSTIAVVAQPGVDTAALLDAQNTATASNANPTVSVTQVATNVAVLGHLSWDGGTFTITDTDTRLLTDPNGNTEMPIDIQWRRSTSTGSKSTAWTLSGSPAAWFAGILLLKESTTTSFTGTGAATITHATGAAAGSSLLAITGTHTRTLTPATGAAAGAEVFAGVAAGTTAPSTGAATGTQGAGGFTGTAAGTTAPATSSASGLEVFEGTVARPLTPATGQAAGSSLLAITGTHTRTLTPATGAASAQEVFAGAAAGTTASLTGTAAGTQGAMVFIGAGAGTLAPLRGWARGFAPVVPLSLGLLAPAPAGAALGVAPFGPFAPAALAAASKSDPAELAA